jgi:hypothetical protein
LAASAFALFSIETKYGFENVFRISATFTFLPLEPVVPLAAADPLELPEGVELLELLEPHAATDKAAAVTANPAVMRRRRRRATDRSG